MPVQVTQDMVGHKLGEFAFTKKRFKYKCALLRRFRFRAEEAHGVLQTYEEQVMELPMLIIFPWRTRGFTAAIVCVGALA